MNATIDPARRLAYQRLLWFGCEDIATRCRDEVPDVDCIAAISAWLATMAAHAGHDFARFHEDWFWLSHKTLCHRFPHRNLDQYRLYFEQRRSDLAQASHSISYAL
jgi:hypothetical protein